MTQALVITGSVGAGKSTTAQRIGSLLEKQNIARAIIDLDYLRDVSPWSNEDPFYEKLGIENLASIFPNYQKRGIDKFIIPSVIERQQSIVDISNALDGAKVTLVYLKVGIDNLHDRLNDRHQDDKEDQLNWYLNRAVELTHSQDQLDFVDFTIDVDDKTIDVVAQTVLSDWMKHMLDRPIDPPHDLPR